MKKLTLIMLMLCIVLSAAAGPDTPKKRKKNKRSQVVSMYNKGKIAYKSYGCFNLF